MCQSNHIIYLTSRACIDLLWYKGENEWGGIQYFELLYVCLSLIRSRSEANSPSPTALGKQREGEVSH
ncbi:hypothetical protein HanIR_Chr06g0298111 [Helianthus annuus]|nr:hypothetical protein HanIR_Chr06g0298111 [Helianthus annuus]